MIIIPYNKKLTPIAKELRLRLTESERKLWNYILRDRQLEGYKFLRQKPILSFIVDFYCSELQLVIELDGPIHEFKISYDEMRVKKIEKLGLKVMSFSNEEIMNNISKVRIKLLNYIKAKRDEIGNL